jgi:hypothetical protein
MVEAEDIYLVKAEEALAGAEKIGSSRINWRKACLSMCCRSIRRSA